MAEKPKLGMYWGASCGGCEVALLNLNEMLLDIDAAFDFVFCPCLLDTKKKDVEAMPDGSIALTLFNGAIRTGENEEMARLLRRKSQTLIAFGSCAREGCIPGLANLSTKDELLHAVYLESPSTDNPTQILPLSRTKVPEGELELPMLQPTVRTLSQLVDVDYFIPGCPPEPPRIREVLETILSGGDLPPKGSVLGAGRSSVCDECRRSREEKKISRFYRTWEIVPDREKCLLEQGIACMGIATRNGCGALCPEVNMPCTGCYGPPEGVEDQGAKMISALGSVFDIGETGGLSEEELISRIDALAERIPDLAGTFYKYSLPGSLLKGRVP